jgi:hypothetical protein
MLPRVPGSVAGGEKSLRGVGRCCQQDKRFQHWRGEPSGKVQPGVSPAPYGVGRGRDASRVPPSTGTLERRCQVERAALPPFSRQGLPRSPLEICQDGNVAAGGIRICERVGNPGAEARGELSGYSEAIPVQWAAYGGTRSLGVNAGTLVRHPHYGLCTVGGCDRKKGTVSLHAYRTNRRLTQSGRLEQCQRLTWVAWRSWLVERPSLPMTPPQKGGAASPQHVSAGSPPRNTDE